MGLRSPARRRSTSWRRWTSRGGAGSGRGGNFGLQARQVAGSAAVTFRAEAGELVAIAGLYTALSDGTGIWLAAGPALRANLRAASTASCADC
jgi:hypothetical protein